MCLNISQILNWEHKKQIISKVPNLRFKEFVGSYRFTHLKDMCELITKGTTPHMFSSNGIKFIKIDSLNGTSIDNAKVDYVSEDIHFGFLKRSILKENDILLAIAGATVGKHALVRKENLPANTNQALAIIRLNRPIIPNYLLSIFDTDLIPAYVRNICTASAQPNLNLVQVGELFFGYPEIQEQEKINSFISKINERIDTQNKIINKLESLICSLRNEIFSKYDWAWRRLDSFVNNGTITLKRGNVIPKHERNEEYKFPVYSSSIHNNGLMGFNNSYMFDKELITWSVDGGGNFFYRSKHKFNVTNVCGILEVKDNIFNYRFLSEILSAQHSKMIFDYQTKAHPSVIEKLYKLPIVGIKIQEKIALIFELYYQKLEKEKDILSLYKKQKAYLLQNMFI